MPYINLDWDYSKGLDPNSSYKYFPWYCADCPFLNLEFETCSSSDGAKMVFFDCENRNICYRLYKKIIGSNSAEVTSGSDRHAEI